MELIGRFADADTTPRLSVRARAWPDVGDAREVGCLAPAASLVERFPISLPSLRGRFRQPRECGSTHHCRPAPRSPHGLILSPSFSSLAPTRWSPKTTASVFLMHVRPHSNFVIVDAHHIL